MHQAITTRFVSPTNHHGARIRARAAAGSKTIAWNHAQNTQENHAAAAMALAAHLGWGGRWAQGGLPDESGDVFVCLDRDHTQTPQCV